jgi:hypothetical protein
VNTNVKPSALKHGAFSEILILPGEDPQDYEKLKARLFAEYKVSGCSEEEIMTSIAIAFWQQRRIRLYQHVQILRARKSGPVGRPLYVPYLTKQEGPPSPDVARIISKMNEVKKAMTNVCSSWAIWSPSLIWTKSWTWITSSKPRLIACLSASSR